MDCKEFESYIHEYFADPTFDWRLKRRMTAHYFECEKCFNTYRIAKLLSDKSVMAALEKEIGTFEGFPLKIENRLAGRLREFESKFFFAINLEPLHAVRGQPSRRDNYHVGESIVLEFEPPRKQDGHLIVLHLDSENNVDVVFPRKQDDISFLRAKEEKSIILEIDEPKGKHLVKAFLLPVSTIGPRAAIRKIGHTVAERIEELFNAVDSIKEDEWMEAIVEYEVV